MTVFYKIDPMGRSTGRVQGKRMRTALGVPKGVGFCVWMPGHLLRSPALLELPLYARQLLDGVMSEYAEQGGKTNGHLIVPYNDLVKRGMRRSSIRDGIYLLLAVGIIACKRDTRSHGTVKKPTEYRLTFLGTPDSLTPTNEWLAIKTTEDAQARIENARKRLEAERERERNSREARKKQRRLPDSLVAHAA